MAIHELYATCIHYIILYIHKKREIGVFVTTKSSIDSHPDYILFEGDL